MDYSKSVLQFPTWQRFFSYLHFGLSSRVKSRQNVKLNIQLHPLLMFPKNKLSLHSPIDRQNIRSLSTSLKQQFHSLNCIIIVEVVYFYRFYKLCIASNFRHYTQRFPRGPSVSPFIIFDGQIHKSHIWKQHFSFEAKKM